MYRKSVKRFVDLVLSLLLLLTLAPIMIVIAALVGLYFGWPIFFRQQRPGLGARPFTIIKFRTMTDERDSEGRLLADAERLTPFGRFLRSTSLDELPELYNVLKGEMSLVGPRPLLMEYLDRYSADQARRHNVKPGLTGYAQVNGRNAISWEDKFAYDLWYVDNMSFKIDMQILLSTLWQILKRNGVSQPGHATAEKFDGK